MKRPRLRRVRFIRFVSCFRGDHGYLALVFFSRKELSILAFVGLATGLADHQMLSQLFYAVDHNSGLLSFNDYLATSTRGPLFGDLLQTWLEYGAVLAACLVRKPLAGTIALTVNGLIQVFIYGTHDPHILYGFSGLGADIVFARFRYARYDGPVLFLAGAALGLFWYPIVFFTHGVYLYPPSFVLSDLLTRVIGSGVGDGLIGAALAIAVTSLAGGKWSLSLGLGDGRREITRRDVLIGASVVGLGVLLIAATSSSALVAQFFNGIGPKIPSGVPGSEEYNPGYVLGILLVFLSLLVLTFQRLFVERPIDKTNPLKRPQ